MSKEKTENTQITVVERSKPDPKPTAACLVIIYGAQLGKRFPLHAIEDIASNKDNKSTPSLKEVVIGRSSQADIQIDEDSVSRKHAQLMIDHLGHTSVRDLGSTNGTFVNDQAIQDIEVKNGDLIKIGHTIFKFITSHNIEALYHEEIYQLTTTDGLTGAYNKRFFFESLEREVSRCQRYQRPLSLILFDLDFFKKINDTYGHLAGDTVLRQLAHAVAKHVRKEDVFARYGGEEFGLILPEVSLAGALALAEKIRFLIERSVFRFDNQEVPLTISLGVTSLDKQHEVTPEEFLKNADQALYTAKKTGKNRVYPTISGIHE